MEYVITALSQYTNHNVMNVSNVYNFCILTFDNLSDDQYDTYVTCMKLQIGLTFCNNLKEYLLKKNRNHKLIEYL